MPTRKIGAAALGGATATIATFILGQAGVDVTAEAGAALATLLSFAAGYLTREP